MLARMCLFIALPMLAGQNAAPTWRQFAPKDAGFKVELPSTPKEKKQQLKVGAGSVEVTLFICEAPKDVTYVIGVTQFPESDVQGAEEQRLRNARDAAVKNAEGKLAYDRKVVLAGHPGRELWISTKEDGMIHSRIYAVKHRLYQTMAIGSKELIETKETARFLDSFKLQ